MDRSVVADLISARFEPDAISQLVRVESRRRIYCRISSVSASEFFRAGQGGIRAELKATMFGPDYHGEDTIDIHGTRYGIYRTYQARDNIELYLQRKAGADGSD